MVLVGSAADRAQGIEDPLVGAWPEEVKDTAVYARLSMTNMDLKLNRLRLERAKREVEYFEHLTTGGRKFDETGIRIAQAVQALAREIEWNVGYNS